MATSSEVEQQETFAFELEAQKSGLQSLRKLLKGFCGDDSQFNGEGVELPPDSSHTPVVEVKTQQDVVPNLKQALPRSDNQKTITHNDTCNETLDTTGSSVASDEKAQTTPRDVATKSSLQVEVVSDVPSEEGVEVVTRGLDLEEEATTIEEDGAKTEGGTTTIKEEQATAEEEAAATVYPEADNNSFRMFFLFCFTLVAVVATLGTVKHLDGDFRLEFSQKGFENLGLQIQKAIEAELVQSTQNLVNMNEIVKDAIEEDKLLKRPIMVSLEEAYAGQEEMESDNIAAEGVNELQEPGGETVDKKEESEKKELVNESTRTADNKSALDPDTTSVVDDLQEAGSELVGKTEEVVYESKLDTDTDTTIDNASVADTAAVAGVKDTVDDNVGVKHQAEGASFKRPAFVHASASKEPERASEGSDEL